MPELHHLEHSPLGEEHPYQQEPTERTPRQPLAGQPVTLGLVTYPAAAAERVWVQWQAGGSQDQAEGAVSAQEDQRTCWKSALPAFSALQTVTYRLYAAAGEQVMQSEQFTFTAAAWVESGPLAAVEQQAGRILLKCAPLLWAGGLSACLSVQFVRPDRLRLGWHASLPPLNPPPAGAEYRVVRQDAGGLAVETAALRLEFSFAPFSMAVSRLEDGKQVLVQSGLPEWLLGEDYRLLKLRQGFVCQEGEGFYGFGERFNAFNQRGSRLDVCVYAQYKEQGMRTYIPMPFCFSQRGWGLYLDTARRVEYDLAASRPDRWSFEAALGDEALLESDVFFGQPLELVRTFSAITGKPVQPPAWVFGPWMSGNEWNSQAEVMRQVELTQKNGVPVSVLVIEAWSDESTFYIWNDARYSPQPGSEAFSYADFTFPADGLWPDPRGMIDELHRLGIRLVLWQIPVLKKLPQAHPQQDADWAAAIEKGYCLKHTDGTPFAARSEWFRDALVLDPTHPEALAWWFKKRAYLLDELGVDGFKTDGGEHLWGSDVVFANGLRTDEGLNLYPNLYQGAYHQFGSRVRGSDFVTFSRAGFTGAQVNPCHWAGDQKSTWPEFRAVLRAGLSAGLSGIPFWGWDIGGFAGEIPTAELYLRAAAMAVFTPIMQYHSDFFEHSLPSHDRTPWNIAERTGHPEVIDLYRKFARLRLRLLPYIEAEAAYCAASGEPLMRPLLLDWPADPQAWQIEDEYCFGRVLLVAPVLEEGCSDRRVYLPVGEWQDVWDGSRLVGPAWVDRPVGLDCIPVYRRVGPGSPGLELWQDGD